MKTAVLICTFIILCLPALPESGGTVRPAGHLTFASHWLPQAQFAGYYVAKDKGFYSEAGLNVDITHATASIDAPSLLASGKADIISLFLITGIAVRESGMDLMHFGQISQHSAIMLVARKSSGIRNVRDLDGKKIGIWKTGFDEVPKALMNREGLNVQWIPVLATVNLFLMNGIDAMTVMWYNEYHQIYLSGINEDELTPFFLSEYGLDIPEDGLFCLSSTMQTRKDDLRKFLQATLKGWEYAASHRDETLNIVEERMNKAHVPCNRAHQSWMLDKMIRLITPGEKQVSQGRLLEQDYRNAWDVLHPGGNESTRLPYRAFHISLMD